MDTISNLANTASKLIYGDPQQQSGQEPVSGQAGAGTATDPYDSGNLHDDPEKAGKPTQKTNPSATLNATADDASAEPRVDGANLVDRTKDISGADNKTFDAERGSPAAAPTEGSAHGVNITAGLDPLHDTDKTGVLSVHSNDPSGSDVRPSERNADRLHDSVGTFGTAVPSVGADPTSGQQPSLKQQGGDRPREEPAEDQTHAIKQKKEGGEEVLAKRDPGDFSGEPLNVHKEADKKDQESTQDVSGPGGADKSQEKGTGEKVIKSTGFSADGGDFDASKPGAGREADRLLESKGVHQDAGPAKSDVDSPSPSPARSQDGHSNSEHGKTSMKTKIKEKLHIGKH
ncbi:hypothetical protein IWX90DRAFT_238917 [Phyllosticta citrichinensis]|uniref:Glycine-rich cell wall structural protein 1 n=1 Tax=Phyllosticta citrichinensis TaxID=1130410 RepID=A0ABR1XQA1_9PEZI